MIPELDLISVSSVEINVSSVEPFRARYVPAASSRRSFSRVRSFDQTVDAYRGASLLVVAGVHALGSVGAVDYLSRCLPDLYTDVGVTRFSAVVRSSHDGETVLESELVCPPRLHGPSESPR